MDMNDSFLMKRFQRLWLQLRETSATVTFKWKTTEHETWASQTFSTADEIMQLEIPARGRKLKIRFEHIVPNLDVEIESFQAAFKQRGLV